VNAERNAWFDLFNGGIEGEVFLPMLSGSMADAILPGDILAIRSMTGEKAHIGDIVVFKEKGKLVAHRLILVFRLFSFSFIVEKGDANKVASLIDAGAIVGIVDSARRNGILVLSRTPEAKERGRRVSARALFAHIPLQAAKNCIRRMLGRDA